MSAEPFEYVGNELGLFEHATRWKSYWISTIAGAIRGDVLEVGAGIGSNTPRLHSARVSSWTCAEPDPRLAGQLVARLTAHGLANAVEVVVGTLDGLPADRRFDTILYLDVLEHIEDDRGELERAVGRLRAGGVVIALSPAHQRLFSAFDRAVGHHRRYAKASLGAITPAGARLVRLSYLDTVGLLASAVNAFWLGQSLPTARQIHVWDRLMVPCSRVIDPLCGYRFGKSIIAIWQRPAD